MTREDLYLERVVVGPFQTNAYVLGCPKTGEAVLVDPGEDGIRLVRIAEAARLRVAQVWLTHGHVDHIAGVAAVKRATDAIVRLHSADLPLYQACTRQALAFGISADAVPPVDNFLSDNEVLTVGQLSATVFACPGHSPGGVTFWLPQAQLAFVGDTLFRDSIGRTDLPGGSFDELMASIRTRLLRLPDETQVLCGHGPATTIGREKQQNPFVVDSGMHP